jgi:hypothetical protein
MLVRSRILALSALVTLAAGTLTACGHDDDDGDDSVVETGHGFSLTSDCADQSDPELPVLGAWQGQPQAVRIDGRTMTLTMTICIERTQITAFNTCDVPDRERVHVSTSASAEITPDTVSITGASQNRQDGKEYYCTISISPRTFTYQVQGNRLQTDDGTLTRVQ